MSRYVVHGIWVCIKLKIHPKVQKVMIMFSDWIPTAFSGLAI